MTEYVAGFLFDEDHEVVVLITKGKPAWQKGKLNAVGGKIEPGEVAFDAMRREFIEETGVTINTWKHYVTLSGPEFAVHFFMAFADMTVVEQVKTMETEQIAIYDLCELDQLHTIPNIQWLVPMALSMEYDGAEAFAVQETKAA